MKIGKRKKNINNSADDLTMAQDNSQISEAEDDELFLEELFREEERVKAEKTAKTAKAAKTAESSAASTSTEKKAEPCGADDSTEEYLSSDEIDAVFDGLTKSPDPVDIWIPAEAPQQTASAADDVKTAVQEAGSVAEVIMKSEPEAEVKAEPKAETKAERKAEVADEHICSFDESLDSFTAEDTCSDKKPKSKKLDIIRIAVLAVCLVTFVYSSYVLITNIYAKYKSDLIYEKINNAIDFDIPGVTDSEDRIVSLLAPDTPGAMTPTLDSILKNGVTDITSPSSNAATLAKVRASLDHLKNINDDLFGYIMIPGTNISYPIAQHDYDNDYYLDHAYSGENLVNGSIFADVKCNKDVMWNYNTVLYGHNITSGSMFNHVSKFFDKEFFDNTLIYLYTFDGIFIYKPFSIHETEYNSGYIATSFAETEHFVKFAEQMRDLSDVKSDAQFTAESRMLTLSTCTNGLYSRRYALHAYLVDSITD